MLSLAKHFKRAKNVDTNFLEHLFASDEGESWRKMQQNCRI